MDRAELRNWIRRAAPHSLRLDGDVVVRVQSKGRDRWATAANAVEEHAPSLLEALDAQGNVLKVARLRDEDEPTAEAANTPGVLDVNKLADLVLRATDRGAERHAEAYRLGFEAQSRLVVLLSDRLAKLEAAWHRMIEARIAEAEAREDDGVDALAAQVMARALGGQSAETNGKKGA